MNRNFILEQSRRDNTREAQITPHKRSAVWGILTLLLLLASLSLSAQSYSPCYTNNIAKGDAAYKQGRYSEAKTYYANAKKCNGGNPAEAQKKINQCNAKLNPAPKPAQSSASTPRTNQTYTVNGISFKMVYVQGGTFTMGCTSEQGGDCYSDENPSHQVSLGDFYIGETEVTQALWQAIMGSNPSYYKDDDRPVERVSWDDCQEFIRKLNQLTGKTFRLPTEAEWEYAARGGNKSRHYRYAGSDNISEVAWYTSTTNDSGTKPVKTKQPNELGLYDMSGNVSEWCEDWYGNYSSSAQSDPKGPSSGSLRVLRGGSWIIYASYCRVSSRFYYDPDSRYGSSGFRLTLVRQ